MYYVNVEQIEARLNFLPLVAKGLRELAAYTENAALAASEGEQGVFNEKAPLLMHFAQERALILAIEAVTDVGTLLIDGFMMRDASSYEDIVDVLGTEGVLPADEASGLRALIAMRRPLMQEYMDIPRDTLRNDLEQLASLLDRFPARVRAFVDKELGPFKSN